MRPFRIAMGGRRRDGLRHHRGAIVTAGVCTLVAAVIATGCGGDEPAADDGAGASAPATTAVPVGDDIDEVVAIGDRGLYLRCTGTGSPTIVMEGGDGDTADSYFFAEPSLAAVTRTCAYDRANLGRSDSAPGPRGLTELVADLERLLAAAPVPGPYVLVGTSGGGYITAAYAAAHPRQVAGMVFVDVPAPFRDPPSRIVAETAWDHPDNLERRDYLQVEKDAWAARRRIGDIPVTLLSVDYSADEEDAAPTASERRAMRTNVEEQRGWLVLSPRATQMVVNTSHAVEEDDPQLVIDAIVGVVEAAARARMG